MKKKINSTYFPYGVGFILLILSTENSFAEQYFNPSFLSDGLSDAQVSDLVYFQNGNDVMPGIYRVDIYVNGNFTQTADIKFVESKENGLFPCFDIKQLKLFGLNVEQNDALKSLSLEDTCINFPKLIDFSSFDYDFANQKLSLSFPQASLYSQAEGYISPDLWEAGINSLFVNYDFSGNNDSDRTGSNYLNLRSGLNLGAWQFRQSSTWSYNKSKNSSNSRFRSLSNYLQRPLVSLKSQLIVGDNNTANEVFDSIGFRGIRLFSSENMYPNSQQGYAPTVRGIAKTNAKVIIQQNGYTIYQTYVSPGAFVINDLSPSSTNGDLSVIVEENDGSYQRYIVPYSALPIFQREGRVKYDIVGGEFRSGNNYQSKPSFFQATIISGLKKGISIYTGTQLSNKYQSALIGFGKNLGQFGALSFDITHAKSELSDKSKHSGNSLRLLYAKSLTNIGTTFQIIGYRYSTKGFYSLSDTAYKNINGYSTIGDEYDNAPIITSYHDLRYNKKGRFQISISQSLGEQGQYGSLYLSGNQQTYWNTGKKDEWYQSGYANSWAGVSYSLSLSTNKSMYSHKRDNMVALNISLPFREFMKSHQVSDNPMQDAYLTMNATRNSHGRESIQTGINGTLLEERNLRYGVTQSYQNKADSSYSGALNLNYQGSLADMGLGYNYDTHKSQVNYSAAGVLLLHSKGITLGQSLADTAILVEAPGASNVSIENYTGVKTDSRGYAILPYATSYRLNRISLNPNSFDNNIEIENNVESVVPIQGAIAKATFDTSIGLRAFFSLTYQGKNVMFGSIATLKDGSASGIVADSGQLYITGLPPSGELIVKWGNSANEQCVVNYDIPTDERQLPIIKSKLECK